MTARALPININTDCELRLKTFNRINVIEQKDEKMITVLECNNLLNMIFRKRRDSTNYLIILTAYLIKSSLNILKENDNLKKKIEIIHKHKINSHHENYFRQKESDNNNLQKSQRKLHYQKFIK